MRVTQFLVGINNQFGATPVIIALASVLISAFFLFLYGAHRLQQQRMQRNRRRIADEIYAKLAARYSFTPSQEALLDTLSSYTAYPGMKYRLILDEHIFNRAVREYNNEHLPHPGIPPLRHTIGFKDRTHTPEEKHIVSTAQLKEGQELEVLYPRKRAAAKAVLEEVETGGFFVSLLPFIYLDTGTAVSFSFTNARGKYSGETYVRGARGEKGEEQFLLAHCEKLEKKQHRRFYRRLYGRECTLEFLGLEKRILETEFVELGGGGATVRDDDEVFIPGDILTITWQTGSSGLTLRGRVLRVSKFRHSGRCIHIVFEGVSAGNRDLLIKELLRMQRENTTDGKKGSPSRSATRDNT